MPHRAPGAPGNPPSRYLSGQPISYYRPQGDAGVRRLIDDGFQAFNAGRLSEACRIFTGKMLDPAHDTTIGLTIAGALTPAGLGGCLIELMERGLVDFVISTGANLYHDLHYALNFTLHRGSPFLDDVTLHEQGVIRIYDILFPATVLLETDRYVREFLVRERLEGPMGSAEFHYRLGRDLAARFPLHVRDLSRGEKTFTPVIGTIGQSTFSVIDNVGGQLLVRTNHGAPNGRIVLIDPTRPQEEHWRTVLPERAEPLQGAGTAGGKLFATYLTDVVTRAYVFALDGTPEHEIALPGTGVAGGFGGERDDAFVFYTFQSFNRPPTIFRYDIATRTSTVFRTADIPGFQADAYEVRQVFYTRRDGTRVPMFLTCKKGLQLTAGTRRSCTATAASTSPPRPASAPCASPCSRTASSTRRPTCAAAASTARRGTRPG